MEDPWQRDTQQDSSKDCTYKYRHLGKCDKIVRMIAIYLIMHCELDLQIYTYKPYSVCGMYLLAWLSQIAISFIEDRKKNVKLWRLADWSADAVHE